MKILTSKLSLKREANKLGFYRITAILAGLFVLYVMVNYEMSWISPENNARFQFVLTKKTSGCLDNLRLSNQLSITYDMGRLRFVSSMFLVLDAKFRRWLFQYIPPHPSLSVTLLLYIIFSPILFYKLLRNMPGLQASTAWAGLTLFLLSTGFLSGISLCFNPAKPIIILLTLSSYYIVSTISRYDYTTNGINTRLIIRYIGFSTLILLGFFTDETILISYLIVPVLFPKLILSRKVRVSFLISYIAPIVCFFLMVSFILPLLSHSDYKVENNYLQGIIASHYGKPPSHNIMSEFFNRFKWSNVYINARNLLTSQLVPWSLSNVIKTAEVSVTTSLAEKVLYLSIGIYFIITFRMLPKELKRFVLRTTFALLLFFILFSCIHLVIGMSFYYGNLLAIYLIIPLSVLLSAEPQHFSVLKKAMYIMILVIFCNNFIKINSVKQFGYRPASSRPVTFMMAMEAWANRDNYQELLRMSYSFPWNSQWIFTELTEGRSKDWKHFKRHNIPEEVEFNYQTCDPLGSGEVVIVDATNKLMWVTYIDDGGCNHGKEMSWDEAMAWVGKLTYAGYNDWRLPSIDEFVTFNHDTIPLFFHYPKNFPDTVEKTNYFSFWSSTIFGEEGAWYWCMDHVDPILRNKRIHIRPVRSIIPIGNLRN